MKVTPDIIRAEFIGTKAKIVEGQNASTVGASGEISNETKNTFTLLCKDKRMTIPKGSNIFRFKFDDLTTVEIDGKLLLGTPEDRLRKNIRRLW